MSVAWVRRPFQGQYRDLAPGPGLFAAWINIADLARVITLSLPMFGGTRAFDGPACTPWEESPALS